LLGLFFAHDQWAILGLYVFGPLATGTIQSPKLTAALHGH
jgi:hypothetical protein